MSRHLVFFLALGAALAADRPQVSRDVEQRVGRAIAPARPATREPKFELPPGVTLEGAVSEADAVAVALWNNAGLEAALARLGVAKADLHEAGLLRNPTLSMLLPVGPKPFELALAAPIEALWQRPRRVAAAKLNLEQVAAELVQNGLNTARDARLAHADLAFVEQRAGIAAEAARHRARIAELTYLRFSAGDIGELEARLTRADAAGLAEQAARLARDVDIARERLRMVLGLRRDSRELRVEPRELPANPLPEADDLVAAALASRPDLRAAELAIQAAARRAGWERSRLLALAPMLSTKGVGTNGIRSGPGVTVDVPVLQRNQGAVSRAQADAERAAREYVALRDQVELEVRTARLELLRASESLARIRGKLLPQVEENIRLSERAYENGDVAYLTVLEAERQVFDLRLQEAEAAAAMRRALAQLERSMGKNL